MPLDSLAVSRLKSEFIRFLKGGKIEKISQPEKDEIIILIKNNNEKYRLLLSADPANPRAHITNAVKQNPMTAPMFCMLLRKHLSGGVLENVIAPPYERVLLFEFSAYNELGDKVIKYIIVELVGRYSNIILTNEDKSIIDSARHIDLSQNTVRCILPGMKYEFPPKMDKTGTDDKNNVFAVLMTNAASGKAEKAVVKYIAGMSPLSAREAVFRATGDIDSPLDANIVKPLTDSIFDIINEKDINCVMFDHDGYPKDFAAYNVTGFGNLFRVERYKTLSDAMDEFYTKRDMAERMYRRSASLRKKVTVILERLHRKMAIQQEILAGAYDKEKYRIYGELLTANLFREPDSKDQITVENFYDENKPLTIKLNDQKNLAQNAEAYFTKYKKAKMAEKMAKEQIEINALEEKYMESVLSSIENAQSAEELSEIREELVSGLYIKEKTKSKTKVKAASPLKINIDGFCVYVGKNNRQNDFVTFKIGRADDIWFHVKDMPGSHTIIKTEKKTVPESVLQKAAAIAAYYSKGKNMPGVSVDYTFLKNVKKQPGGKPGMVIYVNYKTAFVRPKHEEDI